MFQLGEYGTKSIYSDIKPVTLVSQVTQVQIIAAKTQCLFLRLSRLLTPQYIY
jgi:hypothetical protein